MKTIILIVIALIMGVFATCAVIENLKVKKELNAEKKKVKENAKIDKETVDNINVVISDDVHAGNDVLHQLAEKRK